MLEVQEIAQIFNRGTVNEIVALRGVNLTLKKGEFVSVIGSNGAGKSTLLNAITGTYPPVAGHIRIKGQEVTNWPEYRRAKLIGRVFQDPLRGTAGGMTIEENMALAYKRGRWRGLTLGVTNGRRRLFRESLVQLDLGLENRLHDRVGLLSGGQRQALTLLMATLTQPEILLLDEHTAALDPGMANLVSELTDRLIGRDNLTALMITHNMQQALTMGTRTIMMHRGEIILDLKGEERAKMTVPDLVAKFQKIRKDAVLSDQMILTGHDPEANIGAN